MKNFNIIILLGLFFAFTACENDEERLYINPASQVVAPALEIDGLDDILVNVDNLDLIPAVLNWTHSDFGEDVLVEYTLKITDNEQLENPISLVLGNNLYTYALTNKQLSDWAINTFGALDENNEPIKIEMYLQVWATPTLENPSAVTISPDIVRSNTIKIAIIPYIVPAAYPTEMFMIGAEFGDWNWEAGNVVVMNPVHSHEGCFWAIRYMSAEKGFKWNSSKAWNGSEFNTLGEDIGFYTVGGDAFVAEDGLYMVFINMQTNQISVEEAKVYGMGDCFGGWNTATYPFAIDGKTMTITTANSGEIRMYAASDIAPNGNDWWQMEFVPIDGVIVYRGTGEDQTRITVDAGKKVVLDFNAGTGKFE